MDIHIEERAGRKGGRRADDHRRGKAAEGRGGHGSGGGGGGGRGQVNREVAVSKALSKLLRHAAEDEGLVLDKEGFARLDQVVRFACLSFWRHLHLHLSQVCSRIFGSGHVHTLQLMMSMLLYLSLTSWADEVAAAEVSGRHV
jgi:hypothetical protein